MNFGRGSPIAQKNDIVQNGDSWFSLTPPGRLNLPRSAPVSVEMPGNQRIGTWQDLLGMYTEILNQDVAIQTANPSSVTSINGRNFAHPGVGTEANQHLDRYAGAYVQNYSNDSAGSCNNRAAEVIGIRTSGNYVLSNGQHNNGQISIRRTDSNICTQVPGNWRELESTTLMLDRQHSLRRTDSNSSTQVASNCIDLESTNLMLDRQHSISCSNQRLNSLNAQVGSNTQGRSNWMQHEANILFRKQKSTVVSNQRLSEASSLQMHNTDRNIADRTLLLADGYHVPYRTSYNLNSPPRQAIANAELSVASSFPFTPVTPDQRKQLDHQIPSERLNVVIDECSSQEKDKQWHVVSSSSGENENTFNEFSQVVVDATSAAISTPQKETNVFNEIEEHGLDLNKTPDQKTPRKRKHRPKVVREGKPRKAPKSAPPKTEVPNGTPSGKRKYVRKKNIKTVESQQDVVVNEVRSAAVESSPKSVRRALNFNLESNTGDASQNMRDGHQAVRHQENKRPFNLNVDAEDKDCTVIDSMSRTSSCLMEQSRQRKEFIQKNQQMASTISLLHSNCQMPSQLESLTEQRKDHTFARNLNMRNAAPGQSSLINGYIQVPGNARREQISQDVFQADLYGQPSTQLAMKDTGNWNENRGLKRSHYHTVQEIHPHNQNLMIPPLLSLRNSCVKNKNGDSSNIGTMTSGTQKRLNTGNGLYANISSMHPPTVASIYSPRQLEGDQVRLFANSGSSELNSRLLNSDFERDKTSKKLDCLINGMPMTPITGKQNYQKQQASITLHVHRGQTTEHVYRYEASTSDPQQAIVGYNPHMSTSKQMLKPSPLKQGSGRAEKMLVQQHNYALQSYKPTPKKARGKLGKQKMSLLIEEITFRLEALLINIKRNEEIEQEQHALVPYKGSSTIVPYEQFDIKKRKPRPKVDLDPETDRIWKLLMGIEGSESAEATDKDKEKWWEGEREVFRGRADSFIARMHLVQGDRRFSRWKGSVVDSVIGVFLTQNVSDHLSSSAFMSLVARFPLQSSGLVQEPDIQVLESTGSSLVEEPDIQVLESSGSINCHEEIERQPIHNLPSYIPPNYFDNLPSYKANVASDYNRKSDAEINVSRNSYEPFIQASEENIISNTRSHSMEELQGTGYNSFVNCSPLKTVLQTEVTLHNGIYNHANGSSGISTQWHEQSEDPIFGRHNYLRGPAIFPDQTNSHIPHGPVLSSRDIQLNLTPESIVNDSRKFGLPGDELLPCFPTTRTKMDGANLMKRYTGDTTEGTPALQNGVPNVQADLSSLIFPAIRHTEAGSVQPQHSPHSNKHELDTSKNLHSELTIATKPGTPAPKEKNRINGQQTQKLSNTKFGSNANIESNSSVMPLSETSTNVSHAKKGKGEAGRKIKIDWDYLRKDAQLNGKREISKDAMDSMDYEAMRSANVNEISDAIRERGMNNMLAERIKDFLDRLVSDHGSIDLEWLRDVPPDKAKDYLLSFRGLGLKSVECVRLLTLHQLAFPVDTNVGRIAVRLGWVPLQPLPESLQLHLLELYPILESIQKYLWPRLCKLDQQTLYELHYQMITFGKVFCTKSKPNCNACPMRGECRHFASAFASARLALPGPEEKSLVSSAVPVATNSDPLRAVKPVQLLEGVQDRNDNTGFLTKKYEPIVEEPSTPEQEIIELVESDIEDAFGEDPDEIPTIKLNLEEFTTNLQNYMQDNMELQEGDMSRALVALNPEAASIPTPKLKNVSRLRTEHQVYELPDSHPLLEGLDRREPDDPSPYLLAIWTPGETADSVQPPEKRCETHESGQLCNDDTCFSCNSTREANSQIVRGTLLIPCRTAMRGSFPLNGTYFQVNEMFADHESSLNPIDVPRSLIWNLPRRTVYFGTSVTSIFKGLPTEEIQYCFWRGFVCVRGFDHKQRAPRPLMARLHFPASKLAKAKK